MVKDTGKKANIEIVKQPEYADMIINDVRLHGTPCRNPQNWYPELVYNAEKHQSARIFTPMQNVRMGTSSKFGLVMESKFPMSEENTKAYTNAIASGKTFKIYIPKDGMVKIFFDKNLQEAIRANNRRVGFEQYKIMEGYGKLLSFSINNAIMTMLIAVKS